MMNHTVKLYSLDYSYVRTYWAAGLFVLGNMALPYLFHLIPQGGMTWLPIYFFTLVGAYKYGWRVGLLTAVVSPLLNAALFGMPMPAALPAILLKSVLLALAAGFTARLWQRVSIPLLVLVVAGYQVAGTLGEWALKGDFYAALQDFRIGVPGMLLQVFGGYGVIRYFIRR